LDRRIGIFVDSYPGGCVWNKDETKTAFNILRFNLILNFSCNIDVLCFLSRDVTVSFIIVLLTPDQLPEGDISDFKSYWRKYAGGGIPIFLKY